jgi:hypothetical protein
MIKSGGIFFVINGSDKSDPYIGQARIYTPNSAAWGFNASRAIAMNSSSSMFIFSHSRIISREQFAAKRLSFSFFFTLFTFTVSSFLSGRTSAVAISRPVIVSPQRSAQSSCVPGVEPFRSPLCALIAEITCSGRSCSLRISAAASPCRSGVSFVF